MKKILALTLSIVLLAAFATACSQPSQDGGPAVANPIEEVDSADQIMDELDIFITVPDGAKDVQYSIIDHSVAQVDFVLDGVNYNHRIKKTDQLEDISGVYTEFETEKDMEWVDYPYHIAYNEGGEGVSTWYDELVQASYSVDMESGASEAALESVSIALIPAG